MRRGRSVGTYVPPEHYARVPLLELLGGVREIEPKQQQRLALPDLQAGEKRLDMFCAGDQSLVRHRSVAVVGSRKVSPEGVKRTQRLARELVLAQVVVVSGLALGVDIAAHRTAIEAGGKTIAVIGTPLDTAYPVEHAAIQEQIYRDHLLMSQFALGSRIYPTNFPQRNKIMAAITDATVIVEASDTSGALHQAVECGRLGRWLFIMRSVVDDPKVTWPRKFLKSSTVQVLDRTTDLLQAIGVCR